MNDIPWCLYIIAMTTEERVALNVSYWATTNEKLQDSSTSTMTVNTWVWQHFHLLIYIGSLNPSDCGLLFLGIQHGTWFLLDYSVGWIYQSTYNCYKVIEYVFLLYVHANFYLRLFKDRLVKRNKSSQHRLHILCNIIYRLKILTTFGN